MQIGSTIFHRSLQLGEAQMGPPEVGCPFCEGRSRRPLFPLQHDPLVTLLRCDACRAASASRIPTDDALTAYYRRYYESPVNSPQDGQVTVNDPDRFGRHLAETARPYFQGRSVSILDFGGGDGSIARATAARLLADGVDEVRVTIIDYNEQTVSPGDARISISRANALDGLTPGGMDFVVASAIIEHLPAPREALESLLAQVAGGGVFYARTPYIAPLMCLVRRVGIHLDFTYPGHIHDLGQEFWETYFAGREATGEFRLLASRPSLVETTVRQHPLRTVVAHALKSPWYILGKSYKFVGGWEVFAQRTGAGATDRLGPTVTVTP